jgi:ribosomal protein S12
MMTWKPNFRSKEDLKAMPIDFVPAAWCVVWVKHITQLKKKPNSKQPNSNSRKTLQVSRLLMERITYSFLGLESTVLLNVSRNLELKLDSKW